MYSVAGFVEVYACHVLVRWHSFKWDGSGRRYCSSILMPSLNSARTPCYIKEIIYNHYNFTISGNTNVVLPEGVIHLLR